MPESELYLLLGRIEGKLDSVIKNAEAHAENVANLSKRVSALEASRSWLLGAVAAISMIIPLMKDYINK